MPINQNLGHVLVVGGAGYIGSHMVLQLQEAGYQPIVLDNLSKGHRDAVLNAELIVGEMSDISLLNTLFKKYAFIAVMHFASFIEVGESVRLPAKYYHNNVVSTLVLIETMLKNNVRNFIFSSTAAVYGEPRYTPIDENHPLAPINPYGKSKRMVEEILQDFSRSDQLRYVALRYFNAAGADPKGRLRERHEPETHLIPIVLEVVNGKREAVTIYGNDYATPDGTCIRDFVHVNDICAAHLKALDRLIKEQPNLICNLGTGTGCSVSELINTVEKVTGKSVATRLGSRREGDPAILVAEANLGKRELQWEPKMSDLETIVKHAFFLRPGGGAILPT